MVARCVVGEAHGMCTTEVSEPNPAQRTAARFAPTAIVGAAGLTVMLAGGAPAVGWSLLVFAASLLTFALQQQVADDEPPVRRSRRVRMRTVRRSLENRPHQDRT
jgi:hypothetical protein